MIQPIAIDLGYYTTKAIIPPRTILFRSKFQQLHTPIPLKYNNTYSLTLNNQHYLIGDSANNIDISLNKSTSQLHHLTTLTALSLFNQSPYNLVTNIPLNLYNKENKESLESHLTTTTQLILNNTPHTITINKTIVFPQSFPILYTAKYPSYIAILDIGGLTSQGVISKNLNIIPSTIFTTNLGTLTLQNNIIKTLNSIYNLSIQPYEIESIIQSGLPSHPDSLKIISSICTQHVEQIIQHIKLTGWNIESTPILLTGGGSLLLQKYLTQKLPIYQISNDPINDNVKGLWEVSNYVF